MLETMNFKINEITDKKDQYTRLFKRNKVSLALLFGSAVEGDTPRDVDIAVSFKDYSFNRYIEVYEGLRHAFDRSDVDLIPLDRANAALKLEALFGGILLYAADDINLPDYTTQALTEYDDYLYFKKQYIAHLEERNTRGLSMAEREINKERVETHLSKLDEALGKLAELRNRFSSLEEFESDTDTRELCVHYLRIALESVLDVCRHFLAVKGVSLAEINSTNMIELAGEKGLIPSDFTRKIRGMAVMRNAIVHVYWRLDYEAIYRAVTEELTDFDQFARFVSDFLKNEKT